MPKTDYTTETLDDVYMALLKQAGHAILAFLARYHGVTILCYAAGLTLAYLLRNCR
jgi:hypothetical protein